MKKKPDRSTRDTDTNSFRAEERRLLKKPVTNQMTSEQINVELQKRQLPIRLLRRIRARP